MLPEHWTEPLYKSFSFLQQIAILLHAILKEDMLLLMVEKS